MSNPTFPAVASEYHLARTTSECGGLGWVLEPSRAALLVHDLLPYYVQVLGSTTRRSVIEGCAVTVRWARLQGLPVLASGPRPADHRAQRGLGGRLWGLGPSRTEAATPCLANLVSDDVSWVRKRSLSAFFATDLEVELRRRGRDQLVVVGVFASQGILATTFDALARDVETFAVCDAMADLNEGLHRVAAQQIARATGQVISLDDLR